MKKIIYFSILSLLISGCGTCFQEKTVDGHKTCNEVPKPYSGVCPTGYSPGECPP